MKPELKTKLTRYLMPFLIVALLIVGFRLFNTSHPKGVYTLTLMHTNDVHSAYGGFTKENLICYQPFCEGGTGGSVRLDQAVRTIRQHHPDAILLDSGDEFQGSLFWFVHREKAITQIIDFINYTAIIPGNHEFDDGNVTFLRYVTNIKTPVLAANLSFNPHMAGAEKIKPWIIVERGEQKIGIVGITNENMQSLSFPGPEAHFAKENETLKKAVEELTAQGVNIIIAMTHIGYENDKRLARSVNGVDIIAGAHSHSLLSNNKSLRNVEGPYPTVEKSPDGKPVLVVTADTATHYLGCIQVEFDIEGVPVSWSGEPIALNDKTLQDMKALEPNPQLVATVDKLATPVRALLVQQVGRVNAQNVPEGRPLEESSVRQCRAGECMTGNIAADALLKIPFANAEIVLLNGGSLRNPLPNGRVSMGDILGTLPFQNTPQICSMPGSTILQALERGVETYGDNEGQFLQTAGLRYTFDTKKEPGKRITVAEVKDKNGNWQNLDKDKTYRVVTVDFISKGGDGYTMFTNLKWTEAKMLMSEVLQRYLERHSPANVKIEGRVQMAK